jgi:hypothetical protein
MLAGTHAARVRGCQWGALHIGVVLRMVRRQCTRRQRRLAHVGVAAVVLGESALQPAVIALAAALLHADPHKRALVNS